MRDEYEDEYYADDQDVQQSWGGRVAARASKWVGAALALIIVGAMVFWAYGLGQRDASAIPVIRAVLEQAKTQPDDPGGAVIPHQDITSYTAGGGASAPTETTFAKPPERPSEADVAMGALKAADAETTGAVALTTGTDTGTGADPATKPRSSAGNGTAFAPEVSQSAPRRPTDLSQRMAAAQQSISAEAELAAGAAASAVQIQLGAYPDRELTRAEWTRIYQANQDILSGRALVVQSTISGGRRFFRMRAGPFKDRVEAQNVCRALQARGQDCLVAVNG
ncbi:MAG TPA: SPOR domain-containing protein [Thermohalobaculum sp.]|nr:SPOR domain-containing protein [Thermohalobaculum sp.]